MNGEVSSIRKWIGGIGFIFLTCFRPVLAMAQQGYTIDKLLSLELAALAQVEINSVSRREESLSDAPALIYVIIRDDIYKSSVTTILVVPAYHSYREFEEVGLGNQLDRMVFFKITILE